MTEEMLIGRDVSRELLDIFEALYEHYGPQNWWPADSLFEVIVGAILTQNTAWQNVEKAISNLKSAGLLNPVSLHNLPLEILAEYIRPSGYYNIKAKRLKDFLRFFIEKYEGDIDRMFEQEPEELRKSLLQISGIGQETADSILLYAGNIPVFVVDAYTFRVFSRHGFLSEDITYEDCQSMFMENLTNDAGLFNEYHALIVKVGKEYCRKREPLCIECPLNRFLR